MQYYQCPLRHNNRQNYSTLTCNFLLCFSEGTRNTLMFFFIFFLFLLFNFSGFFFLCLFNPLVCYPYVVLKVLFFFLSSRVAKQKNMLFLISSCEEFLAFPSACKKLILTCLRSSTAPGELSSQKVASTKEEILKVFLETSEEVLKNCAFLQSAFTVTYL